MILENISHLTISPSDSLETVLLKLDQGAYGFVLVTDSSECLLGTITDGDVRRSLLSGLERKQAHQIMNKNPRTLPVSRIADAAVFLVQNRLSFVPIVSAEGHLKAVSVTSLNPGRRLDEVCVVIMAGGRGSRLGALTDKVPKPLIQIKGKPVLQRLVEKFREEGFRNFIFCLNYLSEMIKDYFGDGKDLGVDISYVTEDRPMGTGGALSLIKTGKFKRFLLSNSDVLISDSYREILEFHEKENALGTMVVRNYEVEVPFGVVEINGNDIRSFQEKPTFNYFINAGLYSFESEAIKHIPKNSFFDMPVLFNILSKENKRTRIFPLKGNWIDIGNPSDLEKAEEHVEE